MLLSFYASGGDFVTEVVVHSTTDESDVKTFTLPGVFPVSAAFTDSGKILIVTDSGVYITSSVGEVLYTVGTARDIPPDLASARLTIPLMGSMAITPRS